MTTRQVRRTNHKGLLPTFAWPGGYPIFYLDKHDAILCPDCANAELGPANPPAAQDINWEDYEMRCESCDLRIESAYGVHQRDVVVTPDFVAILCEGQLYCDSGDCVGEITQFDIDCGDERLQGSCCSACGHVWS